MTTIAKDFVAKLAVAFVAVAMVLSAYAPAAQAQTTEDLQAMINDLLAQVAALQGGGSTGGSSMAAGVCPFTWTRNLSQGSTGADVLALQKFLNADPDTRVSATGLGSAGAETDYYGPATAAAVSKMQVKYRAEVLAPSGLVNPTGFFGPSSRAKANSVCVAAPVVDDGDDDMMDDDDDMDDDNDSVSLSGEGVLTTFEVDEEETEVAEGDEDMVVAEITVEAEDGDIELSRMTVALADDSSGTANEEDDPWDVFDEFALWVDGDKIASFDASDEDEYTDEDDPVFAFRLTDIDLVLLEDEEVEILFAVSVANSVDGSDTANAADWRFDIASVRYFDADGVATTEDDFDDLDGRSATDLQAGGEQEGQFAFDVEEEGVDDDADVKSNSSNPDATTLLVDEDTAESDEFVVHIFDIEVDDESGDLVLGDAYVDVTITNENPAAAITDGQEDVISEIYLTIDGVTIDGEGVTGAADEEGDAIALNGGATTVRYLFEFDEDVVLESDEDYEVEVSIEFEGQDGNYVNGVTIETEVDGSLWEAEGAEDDDNLSGSDTSETHTLATVVPVITPDNTGDYDDGFNVNRNEDGDAGTISYAFNMEADGDADISFSFADVDAVTGGVADDLRFTLAGTDITIASAAISLVGGDATAVGSTGWTVEEGDDADFVLDVTFTTVDAADNGTYRLTVDEIEGLEIDETSAGLNLTF